MTVSQKYLCVRNVKTLDGARTEILVKKTDAPGKEWVIQRLGGMSGEVFGKDVKVMDGQGGILIPAMTDLCSYPDRARTAGGLKEESALAAKSGFSHIVEFDPPTAQSGREAFARRAYAAHCRIPCVERIPETPEEIVDAKRRGAVALSDGGRPIADHALLLRLMQKASEEEVLLMLSPLCPDWNGVLNEGGVSRYFKVEALPDQAEEIATSRILIFAKKTGCRIHLPFISTAGALAQIAAAKKEGIAVTCGVSPFHLALEENAVFLSGASAKIQPPLRSENDREAMVQGVAEGVIDCISALHTPCRAWEKQQPMDTAPFGAAGYATALSVGMTKLVQTGKISLKRLMELMSETPARILGLDCSLSEGGTADFAILSPTQTFVVGEDSPSGAVPTPFASQTLVGKVINSFILGQWY